MLAICCVAISFRLVPISASLTANWDGATLLQLSAKTNEDDEGFCFVHSTNNQSTDQLAACIQYFLNRGDVESAEYFTLELERRWPTASAPLWWKIARYYEDAVGNDKLALRAYNAAWNHYASTKSGDTAGRVIGAIARLYERQGDADRAVEAWEQYVEIEPRHWGFAKIGVYYWDRHHDSGRASSALEKWYALFPEPMERDIGLWVRLIESTLALGNSVRAVELSEELLLTYDGQAAFCRVSEAFARTGYTDLFQQRFSDSTRFTCLQS